MTKKRETSKKNIFFERAKSMRGGSINYRIKDHSKERLNTETKPGCLKNNKQKESFEDN